MSCTTPLTDEQLVAYWADDVDAAELERIEEHLFACASCVARAARVQRIAAFFRSSLPSVIGSADVDALRAAGKTVVENTFAAGQRTHVRFESRYDLMIHHLAGLDLSTVDRVDVIVRSESGPTISEDFCAPFDRERGEVLIACQRHYAVLPPDIVIDVRVHRPSAPVATATYFLPHEFVQ
jgi:hypothetical protein